MPTPGSRAAGEPAARPSAQAVASLRADHRAIARLLTQYEAGCASWRPDKKRQVSDAICSALTMHASLEEEVVYPACEAAGQELRLLAIAVRDAHETLRDLMTQIGETEPDSADFDRRVAVLAQLIAQYVREEEDGLIPRLLESDLDLEALGRALAACRTQLEAGAP
jgi:hemerythrin superfamily protein